MPYSEEIPATHNQSLQLTLILMGYGSHPAIYPDEQWAQSDRTTTHSSNNNGYRINTSCEQEIVYVM